MSDAGRREWRFYVDDMIDFAGKVLAYTERLDQAAFVASGLSRIGEFPLPVSSTRRGTGSPRRWRSFVGGGPGSGESTATPIQLSCPV